MCLSHSICERFPAATQTRVDRVSPTLPADSVNTYTDTQLRYLPVENNVCLRQVNSPCGNLESAFGHCLYIKKIFITFGVQVLCT